MKTCVKFKPCKVMQAEAHNHRAKEYIAAIKRTCGSTYIREELSHANTSWRNPDPRYHKTLPEIFEDLRKDYEAKVKQKMQLEDKVITRKNGTTYIRAGAAPIRESCTPIKPDTKIEDFMPFVQWMQEKLGLTVISIDIHRDEGHDNDDGEFVCNNHAHIIVDWMNHETGRSRKPTDIDCRAMQTAIAESLGMERGTPKDETGIEHLSVLEYKEKKAKESLQRVAEKKEAAETELANAEEKTAEAKRKARKAEFEEREAKRSASKAVFDRSMAERAADVAREEKVRQQNVCDEIKAENKRLTSENATKIAENRRLDNVIASKRKKAAQDDKDMVLAELKGRIKWRDKAIRILADILYQGYELFKRAVDTIAKFAKSIYNIMDGSEAKVIKDCVHSLARTDEDRTAIGNVLITYADHKAKLTDEEYFKMSREVDDVVAGRYDARIERSGLHM